MAIADVSLSCSCKDLPDCIYKKKQVTLETDLPNCHNPQQVQPLSLICHLGRCCISDRDETPVRDRGLIKRDHTDIRVSYIKCCS